jgi:hypothetical protein
VAVKLKKLKHLLALLLGSHLLV